MHDLDLSLLIDSTNNLMNPRPKAKNKAQNT